MNLKSVSIKPVFSEASLTPKVMLVEDDATMVALLQTLLGMEGFDVYSAPLDLGVTEMLALLRQEQPRVVLVDVHLRQMSGFDLLQAIRQDEQLHATRVLMSSGMDVSARCKEAGADGFILKPYMPDDLMNKIRKMLD